MSARAFPAPLAPWAVRADETRGRLHSESESSSRTPLQRDRDRILHAVAFRRLKHKTQVFIAMEGDHYRTRLTHSLEVAQIARSLARTLQADEDLAESVALAHDLGHPPFGHAGERALNDCMAGFGGFDHNAQSLRILTMLERRYPDFDGLNLCWETLEGVVKHNGPLVGADARGKALPDAITDYNAKQDLWLDSYAGVEAQLAALADDVAYNNHDVDDGLRAGLFPLDAVEEVTLVGPIASELRKTYPKLDQSVFIAETVRRMIGEMVGDVAEETGRRLAAVDPQSADDVRRCGKPVVAFSDAMLAQTQALRKFLHENMYRHHQVNRIMGRASRVIEELFTLFLSEPAMLPAEWRSRVGVAGDVATARVVCDYIAGMTDRYALLEHKRLYSLEAWPS